MIKSNREELDRAYETKTRQRAQEIAEELAEDIGYQFEKHGPKRHTVGGWTSVIVEEFGETVQAHLQGSKEQTIKEAKQAAACFIRLAIEVEREMDGTADAESMFYSDPV